MFVEIDVPAKMSSSSLQFPEMSSAPQFNWLFLIELIVCGVLSLFFFFYFNRLFSTIISYVIRAYTWHFYRVYLDIQALQISLLGGRIFFKGIRYHGVNETILLQSGYVTWKFWKRSVAQVDLSRAENSRFRLHRSQSHTGKNATESTRYGEDGGLKDFKLSDEKLPCRIVVTLSGLEWFLYNRSPAYDDILSGFCRDSESHNPRESPGATKPGDIQERQGFEGDGLHSHFPGDSANATGFHRPSGSTRRTTESSSQRRCSVTSTSSSNGGNGGSSMPNSSLSKILELLPLKIECTKGAIVVGNENTRSVMTTTFDKASGIIDASAAGPLDFYRQVFAFDFFHPVIQLQPNPDYKLPQLVAAKRLYLQTLDNSTTHDRKKSWFNYRHRKHQIWGGIRDLIPYFRRSVESFHLDVNESKRQSPKPEPSAGLPNEGRWIGLTRYLDDVIDEHEGWNGIEYARFSTILDSPLLSLTYYWDIPGKIPSDDVELSSSIHQASPNINGSSAPEWGIDLVVAGGTINYGPWADRERASLQEVFFPNTFRTAQPTETLAPGMLRQSTLLNIHIDISEETTLRIPTREESKDWQWKGRAGAMKDASKYGKKKQKRHGRGKDNTKSNTSPEIRPFGWFSLCVAGDSTIKYEMDIVASKSGYHNNLSLDLRDARMSSSVNHGLLWQSPRQLVSCSLSNPLAWNTLHRWSFVVESYDMELFLLRDHIFLITDLVNDWTSGAPVHYYTFVPFEYNLRLLFPNLKLFVNVNDSNIINNPSDIDDNTFLVITAKDLAADIDIPATEFRPVENAVGFSVDLADGRINVHTPVWQTYHTFLTDTAVASLESLAIRGSYTYNASTSPTLTDTVLMHLDGKSPRVYLYGFLIRYFMRIKDNYFGEDMHFKTLEEFQASLNLGHRAEAHGTTNTHKISNDLDVIIRVTVENACALLPANIYDHSNSLRLNATSLALDMRFTNYYMDLQGDLSPVEVCLETIDVKGAVNASSTQLFIDGLSVFGHRLFGLPPAEPTYVCNWDFDVGKIIGECSPEFLRSTIASLRNIDFTLDDEENALPPPNNVALHDVTFLRVKVVSLHLTVLVEGTALTVGCDEVALHFNDWAVSQFSKRITVTIPKVTFAAFGRKSVTQQEETHDRTVTQGLFETTIDIVILQRKSNFFEHREMQQEHIRVHDQRTSRTPWLLLDPSLVGELPHSRDFGQFNPPAMVLPYMPEPLFSDTPPSNRWIGISSSGRRLGLKQKSSFLSTDSRSMHSQRSFASRAGHYETGRLPNIDNSQLSSRFSEQNSSRIRSRSPEDVKNSRPIISSSWSIPNFLYWQIIPDSKLLPTLPAVALPDERKRDTNDGIFEVPRMAQGENIAHISVLCNLTSGLRGFCTPDCLFAIASLSQELQDIRPLDIIDSLQTSVVSELVKHLKPQVSPRKALNVSIHIPAMKLDLVNLSTSRGANFQYQFQDKYTLLLTGFHFASRVDTSRQENTLLKEAKRGVIFHSIADSFVISATGKRADISEEQAGLAVTMKNIIFWMKSQPDAQCNLQVRVFDTITSTKAVESLSVWLHRTTTMLDAVTSSFQQKILPAGRLRIVASFVSKFSSGIPDPLFLTRPFYILKSSRSHIRLQDSWKILARLRNIYRRLSPEDHGELERGLLGESSLDINEKKARMLITFKQWQNWDLTDVENSLVMRKIWGDFGKATKMSTIEPLRFICSVETFKISVDPGPKESDVIVENASFALMLGLQRDIAGNDIGLHQSIILQCHSSSVDVRIRWEIFDVIEAVAKTISTPTLKSTVIPGPVERNKNRKAVLTLVFGTNLGTITLDSLNLTMALAGHGLRGSFFHHEDMGISDELSILLSGDACSAKFYNASRVIMAWKLWQPYLYNSCTPTESQTFTTYDWKVAASCHRLFYDMKEDPSGIIQVADRIIGDEIRYIQNLLRRLEMRYESNEKRHSALPVTNQRRHNFRVAMFLDNYQIHFSLLPSLNYTISGDIARISAISSTDTTFELDFDSKRNTHSFQSVTEDVMETVASFNVPPINGYVHGRSSLKRLALEGNVTIELIRLEASAIRSLLSAVNRPEIFHFISEVKKNADELQSHFKEVLTANTGARPPIESSSNRELVYTACLTMAGLGIHARAPGLRSRDYAADMDFGLGTTQFRLDNASEKQIASGFPEFHIRLSQISLDLWKRENLHSTHYGSVMLDAGLLGTSTADEKGEDIRLYHLTSKAFEINLFAETTSLVIDIVAHLQDRIKTLDLSEDVKRLRNLGRLAGPRSHGLVAQIPEFKVDDGNDTRDLFDVMFRVVLENIQVSWIMDDPLPWKTGGHQSEDLVFSIRNVTLASTKKNAAKLHMQDMQLQMCPRTLDKRKRSLNSALMPELVFNVAYLSSRENLRLALQAAGKSLDIRATTEFILPASMLQTSIASASEKLRETKAIWAMAPSTTRNGNPLMGNKKLSSLLVDVDFAGASVSLLGRHVDDQQTSLAANLRGNRTSEAKYSQYPHDNIAKMALLQSPGVAVKVQFDDTGVEDPTLNAEVRISPSNNVLYPTIVPLIKQITATIPKIVGNQPTGLSSKSQTPRLSQETPRVAPSPSTILGRCKLNVGLRISKQVFTLSCQPIARVAATAQFDGSYVTINTVQSAEQHRFFAILVAFNSLQASVKHVYSNESTACFEVQSIVMSMMNSKHVSTASGISAILKVGPTKMAINAKQVQDLLLFREIWVPSSDEPAIPSASQTPLESQALIVQRYQQVASAEAFPWNTIVAIEELDIKLDLGQTLGQADFIIKSVWLSSKKTSDWEQNLCAGFQTMAIESKGRMSGYVELTGLKVRTLIIWPDQIPSFGRTPLIQAAIGFTQLQANASFEYQPFIVADIVAFEFLMYNVHSQDQGSRDRLVSILEGDKVQVFCTTLTASQSLALYQTWQRLVQDKYAAFEASLKEVEKYVRRRSSTFVGEMESPKEDEKIEKAPISLHTDVVVTIRAINIGAFPSTFYDNQIFKMEALDAQARFSVAVEDEKLHSSLGLTLGQLRVALSSVNRPPASEMGELSVSDVAIRATGSRGGTILKVPRLIASMETWQIHNSKEVEYIFKSAFEGKVDVGWNYSRISFIRGMWTQHSQALASRLGKPLAPSALHITEELALQGEEGESKMQQKITAVVNMPQSRYIYRALVPPVIETPQLRDMGEATPPLEWIGLHRDKLPNVTHQIVIATLLEIAKEVEDAYSKILG